MSLELCFPNYLLFQMMVNKIYIGSEIITQNTSHGNKIMDNYSITTQFTLNLNTFACQE